MAQAAVAAKAKENEFLDTEGRQKQLRLDIDNLNVQLENAEDTILITSLDAKLA